MTRNESEQRVWDMGITTPGDSSKEVGARKTAQDFDKFITEVPINFFNIDCVIPIMCYGVMYTLSVGRIEDVQRKGQKAKTPETIFSIDNHIVDLLFAKLDKMSDKEKERTTILRKNIYIMQAFVENTSNWPKPFNTRADN